ncbi:MAG: LicD family protein [Sarcina sp.]|nr:LicD family protein [Sarcina sp.]
MSSYEPEVLEKIQNLEKEMLEDFGRICKENHLTWFAIGGTLLGAVRHQDMIPWDDDIDLAILRKDYIRLKRIVREQYSDKYMILDAEENDRYPLMTGQFTLKGTRFVTEQFQNVPCDFGIYLDLFPFDTLHPDKKIREKHMKRAWAVGKVRILREIGTPYVAGSGWKRNMILAVCRAGHLGLSVLRLDRKRLYRACRHWCRVDEKTDSGIYGFSCDTRPFDNMISREDMEPLKEVPFGTGTILIPSGYDALLREQYGDYMQLPPPEARKNHKPAILQFPDV